MMQKKLFSVSTKVVCSAFLVAVTTGCGGGGNSVVTPQTPTATSTPVPTTTPGATATPQPTATPRPTLKDNSPTLFYFSGESGDFISQGRTVLVKPPEFKFIVNGSRNSVSFFINNFDTVDFSQIRSYSADFAAPPGRELRVGTYNNAIRFPFNDNNPGLNISGDGRGSNMLRGSFTIRQIAFDSSNLIQNFEADFVQFSENSDKKLTGTVRYNSTLR